MTRARRQLYLTSAGRRRVFGEYRATEPSRFLSEIPDALVQRYDFAATARPTAHPTVAAPAPRADSGDGDADYQGRRGAAAYASPYGDRARARVRPSEPMGRPINPEDEDQSAHASGVRLGMRVRHPQFGLGHGLASRITATT